MSRLALSVVLFQMSGIIDISLILIHCLLSGKQLKIAFTFLIIFSNALGIDQKYLIPPTTSPYQTKYAFINTNFIVQLVLLGLA